MKAVGKRLARLESQLVDRIPSNPLSAENPLTTGSLEFTYLKFGSPLWMHLELLRHKSRSARTDLNALFTRDAVGDDASVVGYRPLHQNGHPACEFPLGTNVAGSRPRSRRLSSPPPRPYTFRGPSRTIPPRSILATFRRRRRTAMACRRPTLRPVTAVRKSRQFQTRQTRKRSSGRLVRAPHSIRWTGSAPAEWVYGLQRAAASTNRIR